MEIWPGKPYPLGATYDGSGVNFAVFSQVLKPPSPQHTIDGLHHCHPARLAIRRSSSEWSRVP